MPKVIKYIAVITATLVLAIAAIAGYVLLGMDPNAYKSTIVDAAHKNGVELRLEGDLSWQLFPNLAISMGATRFESAEHQIHPSSFDRAQLILGWGPLLRKEIFIRALVIEGGDFQVISIEQGVAGAAAPLAGVGASEDSSAMPFAVDIASIEIKDSSFTLISGAESRTLQHINLSGTGFEKAGKPFPVKLSFNYQDPSLAKPLDVELQLNLSVSSDQRQLDAKDIRIEIADFLLAEADVHIEHLDSTPKASGNLRIYGDNLRNSLQQFTGTTIATLNPKVLQAVELTSHFIATADRLSLEELSLTLDDLQLKGRLAFELNPSKNIQIDLAGNSLNLDDYLPPKPTSEEKTNRNESEPSTALLAPLAILDGGKSTVQLGLEALTVGGTQLISPQLILQTKDRKLTVKEFQAKLFEGVIDGQLSIDGSLPVPQLTFRSQVAGLDLLTALKHSAPDVDISGELDLDIVGDTRGHAAVEWLDNLSATGHLSVENMRLATVNLEESYCKVAALIEQTPPRQEPWPPGTALDPLKSLFVFRGPNLELSDYTTGVGNLKVRGDGNIYLTKQRFALRVITNLQGDRTSETGCEVKSKRVRNRDIPLLCKDSFAKAGAGSCKPDPDFLKQLLQKELLNKLLDKDGEDEEQGVESLLKGIFKR